jgi:hypothetical protein
MGGRRHDPALIEQQRLAAIRAQRVVELRAEGKTFEEISDELGVGIGTVHRDYQKTLAQIPALAVNELRERQGAELRMMRAVVEDVVQRRHMAITQAGIVRDNDGKPVKDDGPLLAAIDRLVRIGEREAKLFGTDARPEIQITGTLAYEIAGFSPNALPAADENPGEDAEHQT